MGMVKLAFLGDWVGVRLTLGCGMISQENINIALLWAISKEENSSLLLERKHFTSWEAFSQRQGVRKG